MKFCLIAALLLLPGCAMEHNGVVRHVVIGFGVVTVPKTNAVAAYSNVKAVGVYCGSSVALGYVNRTTVQIEDTATNVVIEAK